jgi:hypothetical protein
MKAAIVIAFLFGVLLGLILRRFVSSADPVSQEEAKKKAQAAEAANPKAEFFTDCNFAGKTVALGPGKYATPESIGLPNDSISSLKVPKGLSVTIYEDNDFKGKQKNFWAKNEKMEASCLTSVKTSTGIFNTVTWNDRTSSIIIQTV